MKRRHQQISGEDEDQSPGVRSPAVRCLYGTGDPLPEDFKHFLVPQGWLRASLSASIGRQIVVAKCRCSRGITHKRWGSATLKSAEARWKRKDGTIIDIRMCGRQVLKHDGSPGHYEVIVEDFTERRKLQAGLEAERLRVVQVTMRTVHDIVNNCLNQLQLLRLDAEGKVPLEPLVLFDQAIKETSMKLNAMGDLQAYAETQMAIGTGLDTKDLFQN